MVRRKYIGASITYTARIYFDMVPPYARRSNVIALANRIAANAGRFGFHVLDVEFTGRHHDTVAIIIQKTTNVPDQKVTAGTPIEEIREINRWVINKGEISYVPPVNIPAIVNDIRTVYTEELDHEVREIVLMSQGHVAPLNYYCDKVKSNGPISDIQTELEDLMSRDVTNIIDQYAYYQ